MKPFNLEAAIRGEKVITRDGQEFIFGAYNKYAIIDSSVIGWVNGNVVSSSPNGINYLAGEFGYDLFMSPKKTKYYRRLFDDRTTGLGYYVKRIPTYTAADLREVKWLSEWEEFEVEE